MAAKQAVKRAQKPIFSSEEIVLNEEYWIHKQQLSASHSITRLITRQAVDWWTLISSAHILKWTSHIQAQSQAHVQYRGQWTQSIQNFDQLMEFVGQLQSIFSPKPEFVINFYIVPVQGMGPVLKKPVST